MSSPLVTSAMHLIKSYIHLTLLFKKLTILFYFNMLTLLSAGPVGNLVTRTPPNAAVGYQRFGWLFYMLQSIFLVPMVLLWFWPIIFTIYVIVHRVWLGINATSLNPHRASDFSILLLAAFMFDMQWVYVEVLESFRNT